MPRYPRYKYDAFISYSHEDRDLAASVFRLLRANGRRIFLDEMGIRPGDLWESSLEKGLKSAEVIVLLWCCHAAKSEWVKHEYKTAISGNKRIIPIQICSHPLTRLISGYHAANLSNTTDLKHQCMSEHSTSESGPPKSESASLGEPSPADAELKANEEDAEPEQQITVDPHEAFRRWKQVIRKTIPAKITLPLALALLGVLSLAFLMLRDIAGMLFDLVTLTLDMLPVIGAIGAIAGGLVWLLLRLVPLLRTDKSAQIVADAIEQALHRERWVPGYSVGVFQSEGIDRIKGNLGPRTWPPNLDWSKAPEKALDDIKGYCVARAHAANTWYLKKKSVKQKGAWIARWTALILTTAAAVIPIQAVLIVHDGKPYVNAAWASLCIVLAGALVGLDQFGGWSSGWVRYILASMEISRQIDAFEVDWETDRSTRGGRPSRDVVLAALSKCRAFLDTVNATVQQETNAWATEFKAAVRAIDDAAKASTAIALPPAVNISVTNGHECEEGWNLLVDDVSHGKATGRSRAVAGLSPGQHVFKVTGRIDGLDKSDEIVQNLSVGVSVEISLTLK